MKRGKQGQIALGEQLEGVIAMRLGRRQWSFYLLTKEWGEVVGPRAAGHTLPAWIRKDILWVYADNSSWMQELNLKKPQIIERAMERLQGDVISDIRWMQQPQKTPMAPVTEYFSPERELDPKREQEFYHMTKIIQDADCQAALFKLWQTFQKKMR